MPSDEKQADLSVLAFTPIDLAAAERHIVVVDLE
jgi:hypothetical protein